MSIHVLAVTTSNYIVLHAADMSIEMIAVQRVVVADVLHQHGQHDMEQRVQDLCFAANGGETNAPDGGSMVQVSAVDTDKETLTITLSQKMLVGQYYRIPILYKAQIFETIKGFFRTKHVSESTCCSRYCTVYTVPFCNLVDWLPLMN